ncbi:MAG: MOSC domain-containing protein [Pyrinomonadaceae bacterium]
MRLSEINIYPVKSLGGIRLDEAVAEARGLRYDRRWMLVDGEGRFLSQREQPRMAAIRIRMDGDGLVASCGAESVLVPFPDPGREPDRRVKVWSSSVKAVSYDEEIDRWFSQALAVDCRLVAMTERSIRRVNPFYAVRRSQDQVSFADGYPLLLTGQGSLDELNSRLSSPVTMDRFRPNLVVEGAAPFAEDEWKKVRIGSTVFHVVKPCARCVITTIDQATGVKTGPEPLKTLATFRSRGNKVIFGQNLISDEPGGTLAVGDPVEVLE